MLEQIVFQLRTHTEATGWSPALRAALICGALYQIDLALLFARWLLQKLGIVPVFTPLPAADCKSAMLVMPTLLRQQDELEGLMQAAQSAATNGYPGPLCVVMCIDGCAEKPELYARLQAWAEQQNKHSKVRFVVTGLAQRAGKAVAMESGVELVLRMVEAGELPAMPEVFFNMDADSRLGPRALERMVYRLTRKRRFNGTPYMIVTSNVVVPMEQCYQGLGSLLQAKYWFALLVGREYLSSISCAKFNWKLFPVTEVSGALYCCWTEIHLAGPYYARFMQTLRWTDYVRWWFGCGAPKFSQFRGDRLPEAMAGPGDDTWIAWLAVTASWKDGHLSVDAPPTPVHAFVRAIAAYFSRAVNYDPLAKVYTKTPTTAKALFKQRLRWNSSRLQDLCRWCPSHLYHWHIGLPLGLSTAGVMFCITCVVLGVLAIVCGVTPPPSALSCAVLLMLGYSVSRVASTVVALLVSDSAPGEWIKVIALPFAGFYHMAFNMLTLAIGYMRDLLGFGEPTTFSPEHTLRKGGLVRIALGYRLRRAFLLACRAALHGDVPFGAFWFGWRESRWTPNGFDGWTRGSRPAPVHWPPRSDRAPRLRP
jgi:hypothetical protein